MFGFHDAAVLDGHFTAHPHPTGKAWPGILNFYRAAATHDAYFDWAQREDLYSILRVRDHLHDLLFRVLFKTIGYDGPYQSPIAPLMHRDFGGLGDPDDAAWPARVCVSCSPF